MNKSNSFLNTDAWQSLQNQFYKLNKKEFHLKNLINTKNRLKNFSKQKCNFFYDYSKQRIDEKIFSELIKMSEELMIREKFSDMTDGVIVNQSENRAALQTATRDFSNRKIFVDNKNILPDIIQVNKKIKQFSLKIHNKTITTKSGKAFTDAVIIGIGGSYLGCNFVYNALLSNYQTKLNLHFLSNVDIDCFGKTISKINIETTLWIVISKSYTTIETMANLNQVMFYLKNNDLTPENHLITVTSKGSPGDDPANPVLESFHMFDFIGGRYSITSAVGGLPLSLAFGYDVFENFLKGAHELDEHAKNTDNKKNIPLISSLINVWNFNALEYNAAGIIPYSDALSKLAPHIQQLSMESLGKSVTQDKNFIDYTTGAIIFGEPGTNAQHSFFQLAHQGMAFPIEFIGVINPGFKKEQAEFNGVDNHQELWANMLSQSYALATGKDNNDNAKFFPGNRPSSTIIIENLKAENVGKLLSYYEAKTIFEGLILNINPFDQFGVELGKLNAKNIRKEIIEKNKNYNYEIREIDDTSKFYLDLLYSKRLL
ncbi:MAG: glucose-6-phosphate isomerase [Desulfobacteraceae bacterium]|nr:glucose-6-phosphate isomerase [Desulfobacteraceae bacterium]